MRPTFTTNRKAVPDTSQSSFSQRRPRIRMVAAAPTIRKPRPLLMPEQAELTDTVKL